MLPKKYRLKKDSAFGATYNVKNSVADENLILFAGKVKKSEEIPTKVGFVVSKKNHKRAVKRNRLKRLIRESYRLFLKSEETKNTDKFVSLIFVARTPAIGKDYKTIRESVSKLINKIRVKSK